MPRRALAQTLAAHAIANSLLIAAILGWWLMAQRLPSFVLPSPWTTAQMLGSLFFDTKVLVHTAASVTRVVAAVIIAVALGSLLAALAYFIPVTADAVNQRLMPVLNSFPSAGWAILAAVWFTPSDLSVIFVQVMILIPFCAINVAQGLVEMDRDALEMARSFTRSRLRIVLKVGVPLLLPYVMAAARIAYGVAWKVALVSELFGAESGLGYLMLRAQITSDSATVFASCFAIVLIFFAGERLVIEPLARRVPRH